MNVPQRGIAATFLAATLDPPAEHVEHLVPLFKKVYTGSPIGTELFKKYGTEVVQLKLNLNLQKNCW